MLQDEAMALIGQCDVSVFQVASQTTPSDRISLLAIQNVIRVRRPAYRYLEIGSYLGGTLVPHLLDPACAAIVSIDKRPDLQPDERARLFDYHGVTTQTMIAHLQAVVPISNLDKLHTIDADASQVAATEASGPVDLALIDGEHTTTAVFSDFISIYPMLAPDALVAFHDANLIFDGITNIMAFLRYNAIAHTRFFLADQVAALALGQSQGDAAARLQASAFDPGEYIANSKRTLRESVAASVAEGAHLRVA